ncbi:hypothetical protein [Paenibacillus hunanensis]|uniref:Uncharacterized protein n=1 Tax=Paenibacillus hunanensis TaxID=539262 RepID=A0ABU1IWE1_9BACL|nr:hypothetical protein [Paenibacillus hunanensis]MDR6243565.1 hypothetical protein [Paenibacillus hunanensis]
MDWQAYLQRIHRLDRLLQVHTLMDDTGRMMKQALPGVSPSPHARIPLPTERKPRFRSAPAK